MQEFEGAGLIASLFVSGAGFVFFSYGKKMSRAPQMIFGGLLFVAPYFLDSGLAILAVGALLIGALKLVLRLGW